MIIISIAKSIRKKERQKKTEVKYMYIFDKCHHWNSITSKLWMYLILCACSQIIVLHHNTRAYSHSQLIVNIYRWTTEIHGTEYNHDWFCVLNFKIRCDVMRSYTYILWISVWSFLIIMKSIINTNWKFTGPINRTNTSGLPWKIAVVENIKFLNKPIKMFIFFSVLF